MDLKMVLNNFSEHTEKSTSYLKGLFNKNMKVYDEQFGDSLGKKTKQIMAFTKIGKQYGLEQDTIDGLLVDAEEDNTEEEDFDAEDFLDADSPYVQFEDEEEEPDEPEEEKSWERFFSLIPDVDNSEKKYEKTPSLIIHIGPTYYLKMTNPDIPPPDPIKFDGKFGEYYKVPIKVTLLRVSDEDLYGEVYEKGDFAGKPAFVDGAKYTLWLDSDKATPHFKMFWSKTTDDGLPDGRPFTYKFTKNGKYNVHTFKEAKKKV